MTDTSPAMPAAEADDNADQRQAPYSSAASILAGS
jgi:hypothetical protein